jgi:hypothetical protein
MQTHIKQTAENQTNDRKHLKSHLKHGDLGRIAKTASVGLNTLWRWFNDDSYTNIFIEAAVYEMIDKNKKSLQNNLKNL